MLGSTSRCCVISDRRLSELMMITSAAFTERGAFIRRYARTGAEIEPGCVNACIVLMCRTSDHDGFAIGAIRVLKTSMPASGSRIGEYTCSLRVRRVLCSFDHG